jgi:hypothetical protein
MFMVLPVSVRVTPNVVQLVTVDCAVEGQGRCHYVTAQTSIT